MEARLGMKNLKFDENSEKFLINFEFKDFERWQEFKFDKSLVKFEHANEKFK